MTDNQINETIAKVCGWRQLSSHFGGSEGIWAAPNGNEHTCFPNYVGSLDAMHKAEEVIGQKELSYIYDVKLERVLADNPYLWSATARQKAEAFLRTFSLWQE